MVYKGARSDDGERGASSCAARPRLGWNRRPLPMGGGCVDSRGGSRANGTAASVAISIRASVGGNQLLRAGVPIQWHSGPKGPRNFERAQGSLSTWSKRLKNIPTWSNLNGKARAQILPCQAADQRLKVLQVGIQRTRVTCPLPTNELLTVLHLIFS